MVQAVVRPEKVYAVMKTLLDRGFPTVTRMDVSGRGERRGLRAAGMTDDELPQEHLVVVVNDEDTPLVIDTILAAARADGKGAFGDGKIFVLPVEEFFCALPRVRAWQHSSRRTSEWSVGIFERLGCVAAGDRREPPAQGRQGQTDRP
jgi:nitrogen regulatory protein PII 1